MASPDPAGSRTLSPIASVWCRQVDHEAESPGYTAIPDEFPGRRETLDAIRAVGHLTINVADTHDYWDPGPSATLSYYPNLFVYPAAGGKYTCVGRMFLSTEDRPRLGMKTLVFSTADLVASGAFGEMVLRALATLDGRAERPKLDIEPEPSVYQAVGEGFLFHRGSTEPVVVVASDQWEAACQAVQNVIRAMPASLVALGAFLVFPYFLPAAKVDLHQFAEEIPLALAVMRVPRQEAEGDRHAKRMASWQELPVSLRDLTKPTTSRTKETLPLVLQYVRDQADGREFEVARRVDQVEGPKLPGHLTDPDRQLGRDRRREMWRIGTAMETAALLLSRPKGRTVKVSAETQRRANQYLDARPAEAPLLSTANPAEAAAAPAAPPASPTVVSTPAPAPATAAPTSAPGGSVPSWLRASPSIAPVPLDPTQVPVSTSVDPSLTARLSSVLPEPTTPTRNVAPPPVAPRPAPLPVARPSVAPPPTPAPAPIDPSPLIDARVGAAIADAERRWNAALEAKLRAVQEASERSTREPAAALATRIESLEQKVAGTPVVNEAELEARVHAWADLKFLEADRRADQTVLEPVIALSHRVEQLEHRPAPTPEAIAADVEARLQSKLPSALAESERRLGETIRANSESWADRIRRELQQAVDELSARSSRAEEEMRTSLAAQIDLEVLEAKEQGTALREEVEGRLRELLTSHFTEVDRRRTQETRELEQRIAALIDARQREVETRLNGTLAQQSDRLTAATDDRLVHVERRLGAERDARLTEFTEAHRAALAALQTRLTGQLDQKLREGRAEDDQRVAAAVARLRTEVEASFGRRLASPEFAAELDGRIVQVVEAHRAEQRELLAGAIADAEQKIATAREEAIARLAEVEQRLEAREGDYATLEEALRTELDDLDRRLMVVNDHVLPLVRQTWLKVSEQEFAARAKVTEARLAAVRQELSEELRRVEGELLQQQSDLRDRLEASVASHGRIWLNLLRQLSPDGSSGMPPEASPASHRFPRRARAPSPALPTVAESDALPANAVPFANDPPNPMDPELGQELGTKGAARRPRKT
jgi:hypothetical protein